MEIKELIKKIFEYGKTQGLEEMEVSYDNSNSFSTKIYKQEIDSFKQAETDMLKFRAIHKGKMGNSFTEKVDEDSVEMLVNDAIENAKNISSTDEVEIFAGSKEYKEVSTYNADLDNVAQIDKINFAKKAEEIAYSLDERVSQVSAAVYGDDSGYSILANTKGLNLSKKENIAYSYVGVVVKEGESIKSNYEFACGRDFTKFDAEKMAKKCVADALETLGATSMKTGAYKCIISNDVMGDLISSFTGVFSAENVQKDLSLMKDKLGQAVASDCFTLIDDPFLATGLASRSYDSEGAATTYKKVIENGILKTYLYNLKTAKIDNVETTGNASGQSNIAPSNFFVENGDTSLEDMMKTVENGIFITEMSGLHSGLNTVSGDFSLLSAGFEIKDGKKGRPIEQITTSGNFLAMLKEIVTVGNDIKFGLPSSSYIGSPSVRFEKIDVAGE